MGLAIDTGVSASATELMKEALSEARQEVEDAKTGAGRALGHGTSREKYDAYCEASNLKEQVEALRDDFAEVVSFAQSYLSEAEDLVSKCEERESALETAWGEADGE